MHFVDWILVDVGIIVYNHTPGKITCNMKFCMSRRVDLQSDDYMTAKLLCS